MMSEGIGSSRESYNKFGRNWPILILVVSFLSIFSVTYAHAVLYSTEVNEGFTTATLNGLRIDLPTGWKDVGLSGSTVSFLSPNSRSTVLSIDVEEEPITSDLDVYTQNLISRLQQSLTNFQLVDLTSTEINGISANEIVYSYSNPSSQGTFDNYKTRQLMMMGDDAYVVAYTTLDNNYLTEFVTAQSILDSIDLDAEISGSGTIEDDREDGDDGEDSDDGEDGDDGGDGGDGGSGKNAGSTL